MAEAEQASVRNNEKIQTSMA